jgi:CheY-like chemotaxis protein
MSGIVQDQTVLVVEDMEPLCKMIASMLRESGYRVVEAANGADALAAFDREAHSIQLVLTDIIMPRMNGTELALRLSQIRPGLPVLFMSGYTDDPVVRVVERDGTFFLRKPFTAQVLIETVRRVLGRAQSENGASEEVY